MPEQDFYRWLKELEDSGRLFVAGRRGHPDGIALAAWLAAESRLLDPAGKDVAQLIATEILRGDDSGLPILVDWMAEHGRLDEAVRNRILQLKGLWDTLVAHDVVVPPVPSLVVTKSQEYPSHASSFQHSETGRVEVVSRSFSVVTVNGKEYAMRKETKIVLTPGTPPPARRDATLNVEFGGPRVRPA